MDDGRRVTDLQGRSTDVICKLGDMREFVRLAVMAIGKKIEE